MRVLEFTFICGMFVIATAIGLMSSHTFDTALKIYVLVAACVSVAVVLRPVRTVRSAMPSTRETISSEEPSAARHSLESPHTCTKGQ